MIITGIKTCIRCDIPKLKVEFYKHYAMGDGYLSVCIECVKKRVKDRYAEKKKDPSFIESERKRGRDKFHRLYKKPTQPIKGKKISMKLYYDKYPEKKAAKNHSQNIKAPEGFQKHHWSYCEEDWKDVLFVSKEAHYLFHRQHIYDPERMKYRDHKGLLMEKVDHRFFFKSRSGALAEIQP